MEVTMKLVYSTTISTCLILFMFTNLTSATSGPTDFLRSSCKSTGYPDVCLNSLTNYTPPVGISHRQLAHAALTVSANHARATSNYLSKKQGKSLQSGGDANSLGDCNVAMADSAMRLKKAEEEVRRLVQAGSRRFALRMSNVMTWVSAALTDQNTCLGSLEKRGGGTGKSADIRKKVVETSQMTSNALSLVNGIGSRN